MSHLQDMRWQVGRGAHSKTWTDAIEKKCLHKLQSFPWHAVRTLAHIGCLFTVENALRVRRSKRAELVRIASLTAKCTSEETQGAISLVSRVKYIPHPLRVTDSVCFHTNLPISPFAFVEHISIYYLFSVFSQFSVLSSRDLSFSSQILFPLQLQSSSYFSDIFLRFSVPRRFLFSFSLSSYSDKQRV